MFQYMAQNHIRMANSSEGFKQLIAWLEVIKHCSLWLLVCDRYTLVMNTSWFRFICQSKQITFTRVPSLQIKSLWAWKGKNDRLILNIIAMVMKHEKLKEHLKVCNVIASLKRLLTQRRAFVNDRKAHLWDDRL